MRPPPWQVAELDLPPGSDDLCHQVAAQGLDLVWSQLSRLQQLQQAHTPIYPKGLNDESTPNAMIKPASTEVTMEARRLLSFSTPRASHLR